MIRTQEDSTPMGERLAGKIAIVTGAGSRGPGMGNGKAAAILMAREGARVLCVDAQKSNADETVASIRAGKGEALAFAAGVTHKADCEAMVAEAVGRWGGLDILHNNVGIESRQTLMDTTEQEWDRVMAVDLKSMLLAPQAAVPALERRGGGAITCVSSVAAPRGAGAPRGRRPRRPTVRRTRSWPRWGTSSATRCGPSAPARAGEVRARPARNIARMVDDLTEVNRIAAGKIRLDPRPWIWRRPCGGAWRPCRARDGP